MVIVFLEEDDEEVVVVEELCLVLSGRGYSTRGGVMAQQCNMATH